MYPHDISAPTEVPLCPYLSASGRPLALQVLDTYILPSSFVVNSVLPFTSYPSAMFSIKEHLVPTCHIREYPGTTAHSQEEVLRLHVKQYIPWMSSMMEVYEPLWDELLSWMNHSRDLLLMINQFREEMPRPLAGHGHGFGACQITNLSLMHPRLLVSLILLDPGIQLNSNPTMLGTSPPGMLNIVTYRRDIWPSRKDAEVALRKSSIFTTWDQRIFQHMTKYGLRNLPTALYPEPPSTTKPDSQNLQHSYVTLTTIEHQEVWNFNSRDPSGRIHIDRSTHADLDPLVASSPFYRLEPRSLWYRLPELCPSVLFLTGGETEMRLDEIREGIKTTGTGVGGSGGQAEGRVKEKTFPGAGIFFQWRSSMRWLKSVLVGLEMK
ncbi:abhydrolase domain-containing protein mpaH [Physcia stellaris]|nr:abhydrolase domain-containing protein mpaH [Physcia stellaris]